MADDPTPINTEDVAPAPVPWTPSTWGIHPAKPAVVAHDPRLRPGYVEYPKWVVAKEGGAVLVHSAEEESAITGTAVTPPPTPVTPHAWRALEKKTHAAATGEQFEDGYPKDITITVYSREEEKALLK
jgi:hypothetical protein